MTVSPWPRRIQRAEELSEKFPFVSEMLGFYVYMARFQDELQRKLSGSVRLSASKIREQLGPEELKILMGELPSFFSMCEKHGPDRMVKLSRNLSAHGSEFQTNLLNATWLSHSVGDAHGLLVRAFLLPYAELLRLRASLKVENYTAAICPFCNRRPAVGVLRSVGEGAARSLVCSFCMLEWQFRRIVCAACGEENPQKLPVYSAAQFDYIRVEGCTTCKSYLKTIDLSKNGHAEPLVDELASVPLDLWAAEQGYAKVESNLLGM